MSIITPADTFLNRLINVAADSFKPFLSKVPVANIIIIKIAIPRLFTKVVPSVSSIDVKPSPPVKAVTIKATITIKIASNFNAKPTMTINTPNKGNKSIKSLLLKIKFHFPLYANFRSFVRLF